MTSSYFHSFRVGKTKSRQVTGWSWAGDVTWFKHLLSIHFLSVFQSISGNKTDEHKEHSVRGGAKGDRTNIRQGNGADRVFLSLWTHKENAWQEGFQNHIFLAWREELTLSTKYSLWFILITWRVRLCWFGLKTGFLYKALCALGLTWVKKSLNPTNCAFINPLRNFILGNSLKNMVCINDRLKVSPEKTNKKIGQIFVKNKLHWSFYGVAFSLI